MTFVVHPPSIHFNGTSRGALLSQARAVHEATEALLKAMAQAAPHGRDYYPQGEEAYRLARNAHEAKMLAVRDLSEHYFELAIAIQEAEGPK